MRNFDEDLPQPTTPFPRLAMQALAPALVVPRTHASPGGEVLGTWEAAHVGPDFGYQDLRRSWSHTRNGVEEGDGFLVCREALSNFRTDAGNGLVHILQRAQVLRQSEALVGGHTPF